MNATYILPIRRDFVEDLSELVAYLRWLSTLVEVIVVDGSERGVFEAHAKQWGHLVRHIAPHPALRTPNGKVGGVLSGVRQAGADSLVIADDDVRYDAHSLSQVLGLLQAVDIVRPQNFFAPCPWHGIWDTARILLNRVTGGDWPGTLAVNKAALIRSNGYAGDVLFENLEMVRSIRAAGGREAIAYHVFVRRLPPTTRQFLLQRVRQAYDELARPWRFLAALAIAPVSLVALGRRKYQHMAWAAVVVTCAAEIGRRCAGGRSFFPACSSLIAPAWLLERAACSWLALGSLIIFRGIRYRGTKLRKAATPMRVLQKRYERRHRTPQ